VLRGNRAWWDSDDGFDFINAEAACTVEYSWAWFNGYKPDTMDSIGNGNGFKGGGYGADATQFPPAAERAQHTVRFCLAFANKAAGFYANHHPLSEFFYNNTAYGNHPNFNMLGENDAGADITVGVYRNNIALGGVMFSNNTKSPDDANNSWNTAGVTVTEADFQSVATSGMDAPRQADGSLPRLPNFRLAASSDLIDKGVDLKLPFAGKAPDLGAFEVGLDNPVMVGGSGNVGGGAGASAGGEMTGTAGGGATSGSAGMVGSDGGNVPVTGGAAGSGTNVAGMTSTVGAGNGGSDGSAAGGSRTDEPRSSDSGGGCACRLGSRPSSNRSWLLLLGAAFFVRRRRRAG
jgi:MYXO-CTERM domain-containing protein